ncbi:helix-turn-helix domain-containing protein [Nocardia sp. NBC_00565]|uniref:helix-turn-helix domain-containing protein n=1 Tax=Nocardia sp. NBC_00565 TaxID=2975993 RepID=UPI002E818EF5|nr:helix-turn-helix transcriptional regulator [Nocardia sp. NBC_00565]WUC03249.1 helix-turn-helix domain-containing protein [Nocardia sp. NBC_00565]
MPSKADLRGTTLPRRQLGRALRDARQARGLTLDQVAAATGISRATLSRIELGQYTKVRDMEVDYLCRYYCLPDARTQYLKALAGQFNTKVWYQDYRDLMLPVFKTYLELESFASESWFYQPIIVPGLLQTEDYARTVERLHQPDDSMDEINNRVDLRIQRARILTRPHLAVRAEFLLHENVLYSLVGSGQIMGAQLRHIADLSTRDNVSVRVVPFTAGIPTGSVVTPHIILNFPDNEPSVVYTEAVVTSMFFEDGDDVKHFRALHETLRHAALDEQQSRDRMRKIARRHEQ